MEEKSNLLSEQVAKSANNVEGKSGVAKQTCSVIKQVRVIKANSPECQMSKEGWAHQSEDATLEVWLPGSQTSKVVFSDRCACAPYEDDYD